NSEPRSTVHLAAGSLSLVQCPFSNFADTELVAAAGIVDIQSATCVGIHQGVDNQGGTVVMNNSAMSMVGTELMGTISATYSCTTTLQPGSNNVAHGGNGITNSGFGTVGALVSGSACIDIADEGSLPRDTEDLDGDGNTTEA